MSVAFPTLRSFGVTGSSGPVAWSPADIGASLKLWLIGDDTPAAATTEFPTWQDHRGGSFPTLSRYQSVNAVRVDAGLNGHRYVRGNASTKPRFDGTTACKGIVRNAASVMAFAVHRPVGGGGGTSATAFHFSNGTGAASARLTMQTRTDANDRIVVYRRTDAESASFSPPLTRTAGAWGVHGVVINHQTGQVSVTDTGLETTGTYTPTTGLSSDTDSVEVSLLGQLTTPTTVTDVDVAEIIICVPSTGTSDRQKCEGYSAWKYGLQGLLPAAHPYKAGPPMNP